MKTKKHLDVAVITYFIVLLIYSVINFFIGASMLDFVYFIGIVCCMIKYFIVIYSEGK